MEEEIKARRSGPGVLIVDIPLPYENDRINTVEKVIVVWVDAQTQLRRISQRDGISVEAARQRIGAQMPLDAKRARAQTVTLAHEMARRNARYGMVTMCAALGMGAAALFERP